MKLFAPLLFLFYALQAAVVGAEGPDLVAGYGNLMQKLRQQMWTKLEEKERKLSELNANIPKLEATILETTLLQNELKANLTVAPTCRHIGPGSDGKLECVTPGTHVLWNGLGKLLFGTDKASFFNFLTLSYMPIDATLLGSSLVAMLGAGYGVWMYMVVCK